MQNYFKNQMNEHSGIVQIISFIFYGGFVFLGVDMAVVAILTGLMAIDTFLGIIKAVRLRQLVSFRILLWGMITKLSVLVIPMVLALTAKGLSFDFRWLVVAVLNILVVAEGFSCITNILSIKSKKKIENVDYITLMLHNIRQVLSKMIKTGLSGLKDGERKIDKNEN